MVASKRKKNEHHEGNTIRRQELAGALRGTSNTAISLLYPATVASNELDIAILGGGIAGLSTAIALRLRGFPSIVYERRSSPSHLGAGLMCWPNATFVLEELGVLDMLRPHSGTPTRMERRTNSGELLGAIDIEALGESAGGTSISVFRSDLYSSLLKRLGELGGVVEYAHHVESLVASEGTTRVEFRNGLSVTPDIIIGAEGRMNSAARRFVCGNAAPTFQGFVNWIGTFRSTEPLFADMAIQDIWGVGLRFGIVPVSETSAYWAAAEAQASPYTTTIDKRAERLCERFANWPDPVRTILTSEAAKSCHEVHVHDHSPIATWHRDNVLLVGDAAHAALPTSGQGACQALEDALFLAREFDAGGQRIVTGDIFENFTEKRSSKTAQITLGGRALARSLFETDDQLCQERNQQARDLDYTAMARGMGQFWMQGLVPG